MPVNREARAWYHWYRATDTPKERKLLLKLDLLILPYAFAMFWMYYIDASNIGNAWVAGLADELDFHGNQLVNLLSVGQAASIVGTLPLAYLFPRVPMNWLTPGLQFGWGLFTLMQFRANSYSAFLAFRFFVGLFEGPFFIAVHYVLGAWYRPDELSRRGCLFWFGLPLGGTTAGLIQSATADNLDKVAGLSGWRWMFIVVGSATFVIAIIGVFVWPGTPDFPNRLVLSEEEITLSRERLQVYGSDSQNDIATAFSWKLFKYVFTRPTVYILVFWNILFWNSDSQNWSGYLLWLNSLDRYTEGEVNRIGSSAPALGILYAILIVFGSDLWIGRTTAIVIGNTANIVAMIILIIWNVPQVALWFAFNLQYCVIILASVVYGWANEITRHNKQERALILVAMQTIPSSIRAWIGLLVFRTVEAPRFIKGWSFALANSILFIAWTFVVRRFYKNQK
ncbi:hypothetical protein M426DRAFT_60483 [Hypoxylon sp. CI-4A]|nr:hypothetical protein M426DRAFT_60483 [Hypoxylon sp. CI-4A]